MRIQTLEETHRRALVDERARASRDVRLAAAPRSRRRRDTTFRRLLGCADALAMIGALALGTLAFGHALTAAFVLAPLLYIVLAKALGLYDRDQHLLHKTTLDEVPGLFGLATLSALLIWIFSPYAVNGALDRTEMVAIWGSLFLLSIALRSVARSTARRISPVERCLLVGEAGTAENLEEKLVTNPHVKADLVGWMALEGGDLDDQGTLAARLQTITAELEIDRVILASAPGPTEEVLDAIRRVGRGTLRVSVLPHVSRVVDTSVELDRLNGLTLLGMRQFEMTLSSQLIKRAFDIFGAALGLILLSPLLVVTAILIKLDSPGPVLFRQRRAGRDGKTFRMLKFRTMVKDAEALQEDLIHLNEADGVFKIADDPRVTRVGRTLRRAHIDEVPQLVNVLRGEMSLVGPRPLPLQEDSRLEGWHRRRLELRPGITGVWQILGSSRVPVADMVRLDYRYVANWSLWNDVKILLLTIPRVVRRRGL